LDFLLNFLKFWGFPMFTRGNSPDFSKESIKEMNIEFERRCRELGKSKTIFRNDEIAIHFQILEDWQKKAVSEKVNLFDIPWLNRLKVDVIILCPGGVSKC
jgi:hypothetical protein